MLDLILPLFVASGLLAAPPDPLDFEAKPVNRVAFGSCANHEKPQPIWEAVAAVWARLAPVATAPGDIAALGMLSVQRASEARKLLPVELHDRLRLVLQLLRQ